MALFRKIFKVAAPVFGALVGGPIGFAAGAGLAGLVSQDEQDTARRRTNIAVQGEMNKVRKETQKVESKLRRERDRALSRINRGRIRAARQRVRGGLFGAPEQTQNVLG